MRVALFYALGAVVVAVAGLAIGWVAHEATASESVPDVVQASTAGVVFDCPGGTEVAAYPVGSRVYAVAQTGSSQWVEVRDLDAPGIGVWIPAAALDPDEPLDELPIARCGETAVAVTTTTTIPQETTTSGPSETSTTTTTAPPDTTTTAPPETTTTAPPDTTTSAPPPSTTLPDTTPPVISAETANPGEIWEQDSDVISCPPAYPRESDISATVTDEQSGVASVAASWTISGQTTTIDLAGGPTYTGVFGPFDYATVPDSAVVDVAITIQAVDGNGNASKTTVSVDLHSLAECFG